jgi:hypothetical protein
MKTLVWILKISFIFLVGCKTEFSKRDISSTSGDYVPIAGGTMTGPLYTPADGFTVGGNQLAARNGRIGINKINPAVALDVTGSGLFSGDMGIGSNLSVGGTSNLTGNLTLGGDAIFQQDVETLGNAHFANANVSGGTLLQDTLSVLGPTTLSDTLNVNGITTFASNLTVNGATKLNSTLEVIGDMTLNKVEILDDLVCTECIKPQHLLKGILDSVLATNENGDVEWQLPKLQYGLKFEYINDSSIRLAVSGINAKASVIVSDGVNIKSILIPTNLTANLTLSGAGGLDVGAEAANTGYDVRVIARADGTDPQLLLTVSGNAPVLPAGYALVSEVLWFISNSQGAGNSDIARFIDLGEGVCQYLLTKGVQVLNAGTSSAIAAVNFTGAASSLTSDVGVLVETVKSGVITSLSFNFYHDSAGALLVRGVTGLLDNLLGNLLGGVPAEISVNVPIHNGLTNSFFYSMNLTGLGSASVSIYVNKWKLTSRMSR